MLTAYREQPAPRGLEAWLACGWTSHDGPVQVLPDGCVDIVCSDGRLIVAGPAMAATTAAATPAQDRFGVRFRVACAGAALGLPAAELLDLSVPLAELWGRSGRRLEDRVVAAGTGQSGLAALIRGVAERLPTFATGDPLVRQATLALADGASLGDAARTVALGERQLRRRFEAAVGYGPATLVRIHRFQRFLALAEHAPALPLARLAADAGYADQAHLTRECRRLSGSAPSGLLADGTSAAGDKSVLFKPPRIAAANLAR